MTPEERQLLAGLFDRIRGAATQNRDREAETFISDAVRAQPYAPYLLSQTVIVQEQALRAANDKLQELEAKVQQFERGQGQQESGGGGFLGGLGRSIFGSGQPQQPPGRSGVPSTGGGFGQQAQYGQSQGGYGQQGGFGQQGGGFGQGGPWAQGAQGGQGGGFLKGALGAAAGVAGGVLLANSISGLFHNNNPLGIASGVPGIGGEAAAGGETIVNNYYGNDESGGSDGGGLDNAADFGADDGDFGGSDDSYNV